MNKITKGYPNWDIPLNNNIQEYNDTMGTEEMGTTSTTIKGAIKELKKSIDSNKTSLSEKVQTNTADISNLKTKNTEIITQLNDKVNKSSIVNNCNATEEGFILDGRQGKALKDDIETKANKAETFSYKGVPDVTDLNDVIEIGVYQINEAINNSPSGWGILEVYKTNLYVRQVFSNIGAETSYTRYKSVSSTWSAWKQITLS